MFIFVAYNFWYIDDIFSAPMPAERGTFNTFRRISIIFKSHMPCTEAPEMYTRMVQRRIHLRLPSWHTIALHSYDLESVKVHWHWVLLRVRMIVNCICEAHIKLSFQYGWRILRSCQNVPSWQWGWTIYGKYWTANQVCLICLPCSPSIFLITILNPQPMFNSDAQQYYRSHSTDNYTNC